MTVTSSAIVSTTRQPMSISPVVSCNAPRVIKCMVMICLLLGAFTSVSLNAQDTTVVDSARYLWKIETTFGNSYIGTIEQVDDRSILCHTNTIGDIILQVSNIRSMVVIDPGRMKDGKYTPDNPLASRYFFSGSSYPTGRNRIYYRNTWIFINQVDIGLNDQISIGAGVIPLFLIAGGPTPVWINPKVSFPVKKDEVTLAVNCLVGGVLGFFGDGLLGLLSGTMTIGPPDRNLTFGAGLGTDFSWSSVPVLQLGGMTRVGKNTYLMSENYMFTGDPAILVSFGGRTIWRSISVDYGGFAPLGDVDGFLLSPWLSVTLPIGRSFDIR